MAANSQLLAAGPRARPQALRHASPIARPRALLPPITVQQQQAVVQQAWHQRLPAQWHQRRAVGRVRASEADSQWAELQEQIEAAAAEAEEGLEGTSIYLVGMMGSGKSTVGRLLSQALKYCYFDTDSLIEQAAGKTIPEIFAEDGEEAFRQLETEAIRELSPFKSCVVSTGGGLPTRAVNWGHMQGGISVWLNGPPALLAHRVVGDGTENRPLLAQGEDEGDAYAAAVAQLTRLTEEREDMYGQSDLMVSLEGGEDPARGAPPALVALRVLLAIADRIRRDAALREERKQFEIVEGELPASMRVVRAPRPADGDEADPFLP